MFMLKTLIRKMEFNYYTYKLLSDELKVLFLIIISYIFNYYYCY